MERRGTWLVGAACAAVLLAACGGGSSSAPAPEGPVGTFRAQLTLAQQELAIAGVHFAIRGEGAFLLEQTMPLRMGSPHATVPATADARFADWLLVLPVGTYLVEAVPVGANGQPTVGCSKAQANVTVVAGSTAEVTLVSSCAGAATGGLDTLVVVDRAPSIKDLRTPTGKFLCVGEAFSAELVADDEHPATLVWAFDVKRVEEANQKDPKPRADDHCLAHEGGRVAFSASRPGRYEVVAEVSDGKAKARLTFPIFVDACGKAACPGLIALETLARTPQATSGLCMCEVPDVKVSPNVAPKLATIPGMNKVESPRPVARYEDEKGRGVDFVANELLVQADDAAAFDAFVARWNGVVLGTIDPSLIEGAVAPMFRRFHRVQIDLSRAELTDLPQKWARANGVKGKHFFSSDAGLALLAAALAETASAPALQVSLNPILSGQDFASRSTLEQDGGEFFERNAYRWPYLDRASEQDTGAAEAWTFLQSIGRLGSRVRIGIADGGFIPNNDLPALTVVAGPTHVMNPADCSGNPCPWHGTMVALAAAAVPDNGIGVAGPAGPIADLTLLPSPAPDFFAYLQYIFGNIPFALATRPNIINISASVDMPIELCLGALIGVPVCETLHALTSTFRAAGILIFAAAGNDGVDVDRTKQLGLCPFCVTEEESIRLPCELNGVLCVGGLDWDSNRKDPASAFGTTPNDPHSVDIYGPYDQFMIEDPAAADRDLAAPDTRVGIRGGTSFASPFVAGVVAQMWAANPSLPATQIERMLFGSAHVTSVDSRVHRWVNALGAVMTAAGRNTPPFLRIVGTALTVPQGAEVQLEAVVEELQGEPVGVEWRRAGGPVLSRARNPRLDTTGWPLGANPIEAQATDSVGNRSAVDTITVTVTPVGEPPVAVRVADARTGGLCPRGPDAGDAEFGRGPDITVSVNLNLSSDRRSVLATVDFEATERGGDTRLVETFTANLHTVPEGQSILRITSPTSFRHSFAGPDGGFHVEIFGCVEGPVATASFTSGLVRETQIIGDTPGTDIASGEDCRCSAQIRDILFHPIDLLVAR